MDGNTQHGAGVRRYFAPTMREALKQIRAEQGADVVILGNRRLPDGVEVLTATDMAGAEAPSAVAGRERVEPRQPAGSALWTDPALVEHMREELRALRALVQQQVSGLAWRDAARANPASAAALRRLVGAGVEPALARELLTGVDANGDVGAALRHALHALHARLRVTTPPLTARRGVVALLGATGVGKTTVAAKLAARCALAHGPRSVLLASADAERVGAFEQLRMVSTLLGVDLVRIDAQQALADCVAAAEGYRLVLIDTAGHQPPEGDPLTVALAGRSEVHRALVLSASSHARVLADSLARFAAIGIDGAVLTKLDESALIGQALSVVAGHGLPLAAVSAGTRIPDDLEAPAPGRLVARLARSLRGAAALADEALAEQAFSDGEGGNGDA